MSRKRGVTVKVPELKLNTDAVIPAIGFGTWQLRGGQAGDAVAEALKIGYRLIDTAKIYGNEREVGQAVSSSQVPREEIFVTTKLWPHDFGSEREAFEVSLEQLGLDYIDLYLIHWARDDPKKRQSAWEALMEIYNEGLAKTIGVSNFNSQQLQEIMRDGATTPAVNQIEFHPFVYSDQAETLEFCKAEKIIVEAYSPLAQGHMMDVPEITQIAQKLDRTNAQVMIRWAIQHGTLPIPRSKNAEHIRSNFEVFNFEIPEADMEVLNGLG